MSMENSMNFKTFDGFDKGYNSPINPDYSLSVALAIHHGVNGYQTVGHNFKPEKLIWAFSGDECLVYQHMTWVEQIITQLEKNHYMAANQYLN